jgi:hypothetical protein
LNNYIGSLDGGIISQAAHCNSNIAQRNNGGIIYAMADKTNGFIRAFNSLTLFILSSGRRSPNELIMPNLSVTNFECVKSVGQIVLIQFFKMVNSSVKWF